MPKAPEVILRLVENFERNLESFKSQGYNETQLRQQFINPFFEVLGWDIANKAGTAPAYRDVIHEDAIKIGGTTKAPDYCFRIGPAKKFFVEAKKPAVDIKTETSPAYQLRRYAWSAKLPLSILTDFEEFAVYDCQIRPNVNDKPSTARIFYCTYKEYSEKWEQIANVFSKEAVLKGLFDKYASEKTTKRGTTTVDKEFLAEIEGWRNELAKNIAIRNGKLSVYDLNFAVQKTIDRILFLRICEDRGIERSEQLLGLINGSRIYPRLFELFEKADEKYNSGIFHFRAEKERPEEPDELSANLKVDDDVLKKIIKDLYYPCPYEFSIMPAEILGNVYEQFLGKVIRLTASHQAKVEEKPEVKKAGGVYYTPSYIVDYIVKNTVGKLCEGKTPKQIEKIKILDPACGSGSFLIGAYKYLLDYHRDFYEKEATKYKKVIYQGKGGQWFLTIDEKKRILLNNIYGVDIDSQAAEVTKLSLLLKVLENETQESLRLFHERALPDLGNNIKCGNSLIGPDFYEKQQLELFEDNQQRKINAFDWKKEFAEIFKKGGFDAIIGNPPYLKIEHIEQDQRTYFGKRYRSILKRFDAYGLFVELGSILLCNGGIFGMIIPSTMLNNLTFSKLRKILLEKTVITRIVNLGGKVFRAVNNDTLILLYTNGNRVPMKTQIFDIPKYGAKLEDVSLVGRKDLKKASIPPDYVFELRVTDDVDAILERISSNRVLLKDLCSCFQGLVTGGNDAYIINRDTIQKEKLEIEICPLAVFGDEIARYGQPSPGYRVIYLTREDTLNSYPNIKKHLISYKKELSEKREVKLGRQPWYSLHWPRNKANFMRPEKILVQAIRNLSLKRRIVATFDIQKLFADHTLNVLYAEQDQYSLKYILGILNSTLVNFLFMKKYVDINIKGIYLEQIPIRTIDFKKPDEVKQHDKMVSLVEEMLELNKKISKIKNPNEKTRLQRELDVTDGQIDKLVYELYGLTDEEISIVEGKDK
jgi:type I restriction-modification system DNA methylase subunit